ncbi:uncharacterized protein PRCAT00003930001 [Priceomyces carsonii]|uniref:uncharacterized protein n=1 Tax=Priceomyces carsonii TaxID=28549 RepID=UPI002ED7FA78|nr:unnamed protein product [Priceomyces carsonii]
MASQLGIKQPKAKLVTGTIVMVDNADKLIISPSTHDTVSLKRTEEGIILNPQPHENPNDPLNWPLWRRDLCMAIIGIQSFLGGGQTPILAAGMLGLVNELHKPLSVVSYLVGGFMLAMGVGSVFACPTAVLYGKRLVYLLGILLFLIGSLWAGGSQSFGSLMGARVITGIGASPTESLPSATIAEIYFAHERAYRVGIYTMLMLGGKNIVPLLSGLVFQYLDRHWLFWILSMFLGTNLVLTFLFVPETFWDRSPTPSKRSKEETEAAQNVADYHPPSERPNAFALRNITSNSSMVSTSLSSSIGYPDANGETPVGITGGPVNTNHPAESKKTFIQDISLHSGRHTKDSWWMVALRPFFLYTYPSVLFGSLIYSLAVVWLIVISETISEIFRGEGYNYDQKTVGLFYISPFCFGILGSLSAGLISDRASRYMVSKNGGIYEPEFRLIMIIPSTFFITIGLMGFGWSSHIKDLWIGPILFFGSVSFGCSMASTTAITFAIDSYRVFAAESLVSFNFLKNLLGFIFSLFNTNFFHARGGKTTFITYGAVQLFISLFAIPLYIYGKRIRSWTDEKELLRWLYYVEKENSTANNNDKYEVREMNSSNR